MPPSEAIGDALAEGWVRWMMPMCWQVSLVVAAAFVISLVARKASPRFRYLLWGLVFIKLCLPPSLAFVTGMGQWLPVEPTPRVVRESVAVAPAMASPGPDFEALVLPAMAAETDPLADRPAPPMPHIRLLRAGSFALVRTRNTTDRC